MNGTTGYPHDGRVDKRRDLYVESLCKMYISQLLVITYSLADFDWDYSKDYGPGTMVATGYGQLLLFPTRP